MTNQEREALRLLCKVAQRLDILLLQPGDIPEQEMDKLREFASSPPEAEPSEALIPGGILTETFCPVCKKQLTGAGSVFCDCHKRSGVTEEELAQRFEDIMYLRFATFLNRNDLATVKRELAAEALRVLGGK